MNQKLSYAENAPIKLITSLAGIVVAMFLFQWLAVAPAHATIGLSSSVVTKWNLDVTVDLGGPFNVVADATIDTDVTTFTAMVNTKTIGGGPEEYSIPFSGTHNNGVYTVANFPFDAVPGEQGTIDLATFTIDGDQLNGEGTFTVIIPDVGEVQGNLIITGTQTGKKPTLETIEVIDLKADSALIIARISSNGGTAIIEKGAVYATAPEPAIGSGTKIVSETTGEEVFFTGLTGLIPNTLYYVRAFATNDEGTAYGEQLRFTTPVRVKYANAGFLSQNIACNNKTHKVFVANNIGNSVTIIDGISGKPDTTLAVGQGAYHVGVHKGSNKVYVPNNFDNTVSVIDVKNLRVETTVAVGVGPRAALVNELTHKVYIPADFPANPGNVYVLDGKTNAIEQVIPVGRRPLGGAINQKTNKIYIANSWSNNVTIIDGATGNAQNVAAGNTPRHIAVNDSTNRIYVVNYRDSSITVIDGKTNQTEIIHLGWNTFPWAAAVNRLTNRIYVSNSGTNTVTVIDGVTNATHTINVGESPHSLVVNEASNRIYIGNFNDDERSEEGYLVTCIDGETDEIVGYACVSNPSELAVDIKLNKTFVMTFNDKVMTVEENRPVIQVDPETLQIASVAGSNVSFDITSDMAWSVYTQSAWLSADTRTGFGNRRIILSAQANNTGAERKDTVVVCLGYDADTLNVIVTQTIAPELAVSVNSLNIAAAEGSTALFGITSNTGWTVASDQYWISVNPDAGSGDATVSLSAQANPTLNERTAALTVSAPGALSQTIMVSQSGADATLSVSATALNIAAAEGSTASFGITSNIGWTVTSDPDWISVNPAAGSGDATISLSAQANPTLNERTAVLNVSAPGVALQTITVTQSGANAVLSVSATALNIAAAEGSTVSFGITSNTSWTVAPDPDWISVNPAAGSGDATVSLSAQANPTLNERTATLTVSAPDVATRTITVSQSGADATLSVSATALNIAAAEGSTASFGITSNTGWTVTSDQDWISVNPDAGNGDATVTITAMANTTTSERTAIVTISASGITSVILTVDQDYSLGFEANEMMGVRIYPNPVDDGFYVKTQDKNIALTVFDNNGRIVLIRTINDDTFISTSYFPSGKYIVHLQYGKGTVSKELIKK